MLFPSPPLGRWRKTFPTILLRIWLVRTRPHTKYTRTLYPYIPGVFNDSNPYGVPEGNMPVLSWYKIIHLLRWGSHNLSVYWSMFSARVQQELENMEVRSHIHHIFKCGLGGWCTLRLVRCGFVSDPGLIQNFDVTSGRLTRTIVSIFS